MLPVDYKRATFNAASANLAFVGSSKLGACGKPNPFSNPIVWGWAGCFLRSTRLALAEAKKLANDVVVADIFRCPADGELFENVEVDFNGMHGSLLKNCA
ncbi:MAG: hypothetical protein V5B34_12020 [Accumulibacter sp.]|uniref:hypothetical protein n=1 Tax=Accumulibacter sp. TaxID=2053492 RepID=UPI002FC334CF